MQMNSFQMIYMTWLKNKKIKLPDNKTFNSEILQSIDLEMDAMKFVRMSNVGQ